MRGRGIVFVFIASNVFPLPLLLACSETGTWINRVNISALSERGFDNSSARSTRTIPPRAVTMSLFVGGVVSIVSADLFPLPPPALSIAPDTGDRIEENAFSGRVIADTRRVTRDR